jgi:hypothetical protein
MPHSPPDEPTAEEFRALVAACPTTQEIRRPGPWGSTIIIRIPWFRRNWQPPDWDALRPDELGDDENGRAA